MIKNIQKRDGRVEEFQPAKVNKWGEWASKTLGKYVDWSSVVLHAVSTCPETCSSQLLQERLIKTCLESDSWSYNRMAGRLYAAYISKEIYGGNRPTVRELHRNLQSIGLMKYMAYSDEEYEEIEKLIDHKRDFKAAHFEIEQVRKKYALRNRVTGQEYETQQFVYMRMAMALSEDQPKERRLEDVKNFYDLFSLKKINAPTPNYINLGTPHNGLASCFPAGSKVTTQNGIRNIEDVRSGELVLTHKNQFKPVYHTQNKMYDGKFTVINTVATYKDELTPTEEHRMYGIKARDSGWILERDEIVDREWIRADNLRVGDYLKLVYDSRVDGSPLWMWDLIKNHPLMGGYSLEDGSIERGLRYKEGDTRRWPDIKNIDIRNKEMFRLFGYYLAEGCICKPSRENSEHVIFTFNINESDYISDVCQILENVGVKASVNANENDNSTKISCYSKAIVSLLDVLFGTGFNKKTLHQHVIESEVGLLEQLLSGVIRGDGTAIKDGYQVVLYNAELVRQLRDVSLKCGKRVRVHKGSELRKGATEIAATLVILMDSTEELTGVIGKDVHKIRGSKRQTGRNIIFLQDGAYARVREIGSYDKTETVYDLSVEEDASFSVSGVAVHNCCIYKSGDSAPSLAVGDHIAYTMTYMSAGIGSYIETRSVNDSVRGGAIKHQGKLPYYRALDGAVHANLQAGRGGACTTYFSAFDPEVNDITRLKNPMSTKDKQIRGLDYAMIQNKFFAKKVAKNEDIFLFNVNSAPDLMKVMFSGSPEEFAEVYERYANDDSFKKEWVNAREVLISQRNEAYETGKGYLFWADEVNRHTPHKDRIHSSNLCLEVTLPTEAYDNMADLYSTETERTGEVAMCNLGGIVVGNIVDDEEYAKACYYSLLMIDKTIHLSHYPLPNVGVTAKSRLNAGVGIIGLAHHMAKKHLPYSSDEGKQEIDRVSERHAYHVIKASLELSKELGVAPWMHRTKWPEGWLPIDTYNRKVDDVVPFEKRYDWEDLRSKIIANGGIRNSSLMNHMPSESSSKASGTTNGLYPVRELTLMKTDLNNVIYWAAPDGEKLERWYESVWDIDTKHMIDTYAIVQKWTDQAISADLYRKIVGSDVVTTNEMISDYLYMTKMGMKTQYYVNSYTSNTGITNTDDADSCESCTL